MYEESGSNEHECYPITALPRQIEGVLVGAVIKEKQNGAFGISVRTEGDIDASEICARLGGGGHAGAAGCEVKENYETAKAKILDSIRMSLTLNWGIYPVVAAHKTYEIDFISFEDCITVIVVNICIHFLLQV